MVQKSEIEWLEVTFVVFCDFCSLLSMTMFLLTIQLTFVVFCLSIWFFASSYLHVFIPMFYSIVFTTINSLCNHNIHYMWMESPHFYTARQPYASPPGYKSPAPGDPAPLPGSQDILNMVSSRGTTLQTLSRVPRIFSAAISHSRLRREVLISPSVSQWWGHHRLHQDEVPECKDSEKLHKASLIDRSCQLTTPSRIPDSQVNLNPKTGKKTVVHASHDAPTPLIVRISTAFKGNDLASPFPTLAWISAAFEELDSVTTDNGSQPPKTLTTPKKQPLPPNMSYARCSCARNCPHQVLESQSMLETSLVRNFAVLEGDHVSQLIDDPSSPTILYEDEPTVIPTHQSTPETSLVQVLAAFKVEPINPIPSIARTIAASEGNDSAMMDDASSLPLSMLARTSVAFEDNTLAMTDVDPTLSMPTLESPFCQYPTIDPVLYSAPPIPAGIQSLHRIPQEFHRNPVELHWNPLNSCKFTSTCPVWKRIVPPDGS
ncbi:uncharacterized protein LACBIDRAFT_328059 [Laccaria bicolor S238N-H82]|uniref:Predicted protein n=1 Tax=Laccaria bicolor (strain S238N-H82 / ATCC MYA-4686) TaxID=486041 RepID=B0DDM1_LACBS|nr:uncharacterized protein LACBIDRAFT_328059 [Laccaria bicolor S238N-H82]EDR07238.1 predicted protein [Laccaria bicolor S238N-H82]|eukprot:XP_001882169.1 predicted protein [Laccaria bicolor S238N-H82]